MEERVNSKTALVIIDVQMGLFDEAYSDSFYDTMLQQELEAPGVAHLVVVGAMTEFCVDTTCRRATSLGYDVTLAADGHLTFDREPLTSAQIIAYHNTILAQLTTPNAPIAVKPAAEIAFNGA